MIINNMCWVIFQLQIPFDKVAKFGDTLWGLNIVFVCNFLDLADDIKIGLGINVSSDISAKILYAYVFQIL